jgi:hypothetical protein
MTETLRIAECNTPGIIPIRSRLMNGGSSSRAPAQRFVRYISLTDSDRTNVCSVIGPVNVRGPTQGKPKQLEVEFRFFGVDETLPVKG